MRYKLLSRVKRAACFPFLNLFQARAQPRGKFFLFGRPGDRRFFERFVFAARDHHEFFFRDPFWDGYDVHFFSIAFWPGCYSSPLMRMAGSSPTPSHLASVVSGEVSAATRLPFPLPPLPGLSSEAP